MTPFMNAFLREAVIQWMTHVMDAIFQEAVIQLMTPVWGTIFHNIPAAIREQRVTANRVHKQATMWLLRKIDALGAYQKAKI